MIWRTTVSEATRGMLAVDVGGTFTDVIGVRDGQIEAIKVPTMGDTPEESVLAGAAALGATDRVVFNHASTVGLNAIITRRLPKVGFLTTYGHRDMLDAGRSFRPLEAMSDPGWRRPFGDATAPLVDRYLRRGIRERVAADGQVYIPLDEDQVRAELKRFSLCEVQGVAICLVNSYVNPEHEERLRALVGDMMENIPCSVSHEVSPLAREYQRACTTVVDVLMKIIYGPYAGELLRGLAAQGFDGDLNYADCAATLLPAELALRRPFRIVFSGPAAGAVASAHFGALIGDERLLCCDVGGTSSDISIVSGGAPSLRTSLELEHDLLINALSVDLGTLGAGGGSIVKALPSGEIRVGPESAGGDPGPACYGRGGEMPTVTDACLLMGLLDPNAFNAGKMRLDPQRAREAFEALDSPLSTEERVSYAYRMALNNIAEGLTEASIKQGLDPREYSLMAFGAAGPLLLPALLNLVNLRRVIVPPYPGLFSALGLLSTDLVFSESRTKYLTLTPERATADLISGLFEEMEARVRRELPPIEDMIVRRTFDGRLAGQSWDTPFIEVPPGRLTADTIVEMIRSFHNVYESRYGNRFEGALVESVTYRLELIARTSKVAYPKVTAGDAAALTPRKTISLWSLKGADSKAGEFAREDLQASNTIIGPAIIREPMSTTHVLAGQRAVVGDLGELVISQEGNGTPCQAV
jgi:N-methylhydantoinase A